VVNAISPKHTNAINVPFFIVFLLMVKKHLPYQEDNKSCRPIWQIKN